MLSMSDIFFNILVCWYVVEYLFLKIHVLLSHFVFFIVLINYILMLIIYIVLLCGY